MARELWNFWQFPEWTVADNFGNRDDVRRESFATTTHEIQYFTLEVVFIQYLRVVGPSS